MMLKLHVLHNCEGCGACDKNLPGLREKLSSGPLLINAYNPHVKWDAIAKALKYCGTGALQLEMV